MNYWTSMNKESFMASSQTADNSAQSKTSQGGEGDINTGTTRNPDSSDKQANNGLNGQIFKSGPLFISSKGIGWTSWKKRWFILTRTSLIFFRNDPNVPPPRGSEVNLTLGGIDLNNSGSVVVKADKKLLTVLFPDGHDGRAFTLKAETLEDLHEWKAALENALAQAPSAALAMGQNGIFRSDATDQVEASTEQWKGKPPVKSMVVGRPVLLALEDIDGSPSFLEKALRFIEEYGIKVEGILRQSADVEEVERRVRDYEQGKDEFSAEEDAHVIGDCIKHVLREMPSSPVPATCCTALIDAYRTERGGRVDAMRAAIYETFPEPNRRLLQRILQMMLTVAAHKSVNRMTLSALAACMAPLLLRPLLAGDCELEDDFNMGGDGSIQLLQAAAAANHAQAIVIILLEEHEKIFDENHLQEGSLSSELYTESEDGDDEDDDFTDNDIPEDDGYHDAHNGLESEIDDDTEHSTSERLSGSCSYVGSDVSDDKDVGYHNDANVTSHKDHEVVHRSQIPEKTAQTLSLEKYNDQNPSSTSQTPVPKDVFPREDILQYENRNFLAAIQESNELSGEVTASASEMLKSANHTLPSKNPKFTNKSNEPVLRSKRPTIWGRTSARKNLSMESIDYSSEDEIAIQRLESTKCDLQDKIAKEVKGNGILQVSLERRKETLHERRLALEKDVEKLREQLQKERDLRASLESGLMNMKRGQISCASAIDSKTRADLQEVALAEADIINLKQKVSDLRGQLNNQLQRSYASLCESCNKHLFVRDKSAEKNLKGDVNSTIVNQREKIPKCDDVLAGARESEEMQKQSFPSPSAEPFDDQKNESASQDDTSSSDISCSSPTEELHNIGTTAQSKKICPVNENANSEVDLESSRTQAQHPPSSASRRSRYKQQLGTANQSSTIISGSRSTPFTEEPTTIACNNIPYKSRNVNATLAAVSENAKSQMEDSASSADGQHSEKQQTNSTNLRSKSLSIDSIPPSEQQTIARQHVASKRIFSKGEVVRKETQDLPSLPSKQQPSQKHQSSTTNVNSSKSQGSSSVLSAEEPTTVGRGASSKKISSKAEEAGSSSSFALAKLTNRLNFLKERRAQLVNELQNLDTTRTLGPPGPPPRTNSR
ncbi:rho GTPase-activating protein 7-like isoform X3 [Typha latifolia]|uniref:rho GTPase-activating protein 7-like isoform X3 n=1 Tax=Typha latifolia TaxID=4733 RepID=UPI003C2B86C6